MDSNRCSRKGCARPAIPDRKMCEKCTARSRAGNALEGNKLASRRYRLRQYGVTLDDYNRMLLDQDGVCAICSEPPRPPYVHLAVDHDHQSGFVRGLLCHMCNKALGMLRDRVDLMVNAGAYLLKAQDEAKLEAAA